MLLSGRRAVVTGGANGIGAATVRAFAREGARVASLDVDDARGEAVAREAGDAVRYLHCDCRSRDAVTAAFADAVAWLGGLDAMVNTAGIAAAMPAEQIVDEEWNRD